MKETKFEVTIREGFEDKPLGADENTKYPTISAVYVRWAHGMENGDTCFYGDYVRLPSEHIEDADVKQAIAVLVAANLEAIRSTETGSVNIVE